MDEVAAYYGWINNNLVEFFIRQLEDFCGKKFQRDAEMALGAARHSEKMMLKGCLFWIPGDFSDNLFNKLELVKDGIAYYNQSSIEQALRETLNDMLNSLHYEFRPNVRHYHFVGAGIAIRRAKERELVWFDRTHGEIFIYATLRLRL